MRIAIIILIVLAAVMAVYFSAAGTGHVRTWTFVAPTKDDADSWTPPPLATGLGDLLAPLAPHAHFGVDTFSLGPAAERTLTAAPPTDKTLKMEIARFEVSGGGGLGIRYACHRQDQDCTENLCLCSPGAVVNSLMIGDCQKSFRLKVIGGVCSQDAQTTGSLVIYPEARSAVVYSLGLGSVQASVK